MRKESLLIGVKNIKFFFMLFLLVVYAKAGDLQNAIKKAKPGSLITLGSGIFNETIVIDKPLIIKGKKAVIRGSLKGSVITIRSSHVRLEGLTIQGSGHRRDMLDGAVKIEGVSDVTIKGCVINDTLFGIVAEQSRGLSFIDNKVSSFDDKVVDNRGDFIRVWGSRNIIIQNNRFIKGRDLSITRSKNILIKNNEIKHARYGILAMIDTNVTASMNHIQDIYAGIFIKGGKKISLIQNRIFDTRLATGVGILLSHGRDIYVKNNLLMACAQALYIDSSPAEIGMRRYIIHNAIVDNFTALHFHAAICNNTVKDNDFVGNLNDVVRDLPKIKRKNNDIERNYWDRYEGFDKDKDGFGDTPYEVLLYADRLWQNNHHLQFFYATPVFALLDFIERLAPFSEPEKLLEDRKPRMKRNVDISFK